MNNTESVYSGEVLTLKKLKKLYKQVQKMPQDNYIIKWWQYPLLWFLPVWKVDKGEHWTLIYKKWGNAIYLVKSKENYKIDSDTREQMRNKL